LEGSSGGTGVWYICIGYELVARNSRWALVGMRGSLNRWCQLGFRRFVKGCKSSMSSVKLHKVGDGEEIKSWGDDCTREADMYMSMKEFEIGVSFC
jgi:hypothetical protein